MAFDRESAKQAGYTDEEIDAYLQSQPQEETPGGAIKPGETVASNTEPPPPTSIVNTAGGGGVASAAMTTALAAAPIAVPAALGAAGLYGGSVLKNAYTAYNARTAADRATAAEFHNRFKTRMAPAGPVAPTPTQNVPMGQQMNSTMTTGMATPTQTVPMGASMGAPQPAPMATPTAAPSMLQRGMDISSQIRQLAASRVLPAVNMASKALLPAQMAMGVGYTAPDEIAVLKAAEAKKRAKGWRPLNER